MKILVWGFGNYYKQKEKSIHKNTIIAYVSGIETGMFNELDIISPKEISKYQYDKLYIMVATSKMFEILEELKQLKYQEWNKVVLGWNVAPYIGDETLLFGDGEIQCNSNGDCIYYSSDIIMRIDNGDAWKKLKQRKERDRKRNVICDIPINPISNIFGIERGLPIDRYYIEKFLAKNSRYVKGTVLEVAERGYTIKYGSDVKESICMHVSDSKDGNNIIANLETGEGIVENMADCFILTQTLPFIFDVREAARNVVRSLKRGGIALVTVSGITQISRYDMSRWGHYWSFTTASLKKLFDMINEVESVEVEAYGNVKSSVSGLYGLAMEDVCQEELEYKDDNYQQIVTAVVKKG